jgi:CRP-like cAMP-binding protein
MKIDTLSLRQIPLFTALDESTLAHIATITTEHHYGRDEIIILEGGIDSALYYVRSGLVKAYKVSTEGKEQILSLIAPGFTFNDIPALDGGPNPANVAAVEPSTIYTIKGSEILTLITTQPQVALAVVHILATRLRHTVSLASDLSLHRVSTRIAKTLLELQEANEELPTIHRVTQQEIASLAGTAREVVGRALKSLEAAGIVDVRYGHVAVLDKGRLIRFAERATDYVE